jgi:hypothetical protein
MEINLFGFKLNLEILILIGILYLIMAIHALYSCCHVKFNEGFVGASTNNGESAEFSIGKMIDPKNWGTPYLEVTAGTTTWGQPSLIVEPGKPISPAVQSILDRPTPPIPLPEGELDILNNKYVEFKPSCCPSTYSNSMGCACLSPATYNFIGPTRGGNNVPYSEY